MNFFYVEFCDEIQYTTKKAMRKTYKLHIQFPYFEESFQIKLDKFEKKRKIKFIIEEKHKRKKKKHLLTIFW